MAETSLPLDYRLLVGVLRLLFRLVARLHFVGLERVPPSGPMLIVANHTTSIEGLLILAFFPRQPLTAMAKVEYQNTIVGKVLGPTNPIYVHRGEVDRVALREMLRRLREGAAIGMAPEGTRSPTGQLIEGKEGPAYLALKTGATIQPVAVWGQERLWQELKRLRRPVIHMVIGEPFKLDEDPARSRQENLETGTTRIMHAIARLLPPEYRGVYADEIMGPPEWQR